MPDKAPALPYHPHPLPSTARPRPEHIAECAALAAAHGQAAQAAETLARLYSKLGTSEYLALARAYDERGSAERACAITWDGEAEDLRSALSARPPASTAPTAP